MLEKYLKKILNSHVYDVAIKTPLHEAPLLSKDLGHNIYIKREDLQPVFSFKLRGAYNKIAHLSEKEQQKGVIAASAGNHAQGVAISAQKLGIKATIVMPTTTPSIKVISVKKFGAQVILHGDTYDDACEHAKELAKSNGLNFIHPYDDPDVIAGQGTVAMEILNQHPEKIDAIFIAVGGGGLISGMAAYIKAIRPEIKVIGVEPEDAACMTKALQENKRVTLDRIGIFADGVAVRQVGKEPFKIAQTCLDGMICVTTDEICAAIKDIYDNCRAIAEPAGALGLAGLKKYCEASPTKKQTLITLNCGANINFDRLRHVSERAEIGEHKEALFAVTIPEKPGSFKAFCKELGSRSVTEFNYRYDNGNKAHIFVGLELKKGNKERLEILERLHKKGYPIEDLTDNEMAKLHIRHMVGGRNKKVENERLYRFQFPERPKALLQFLSQMSQNWNISLFHYRNHGAAYGRVLTGLQIPKEDNKKFQSFLKELGYTYFDETQNPAYTLFL